MRGKVCWASRLPLPTANAWPGFVCLFVRSVFAAPLGKIWMAAYLADNKIPKETVISTDIKAVAGTCMVLASFYRP